MDLIKVAEEEHLQPANSFLSSKVETQSLSLTKLSREQKSVSSSTVELLLRSPVMV